MNVDSPADCGFFAGLGAGDGHFFIRPNNGGANWQCGLVVGLRADDTPLLADICRWSGAGKLSPKPAQANSRPQTCWIVQRRADCLRIVSILDGHPPLGKKSVEYEIWRDAVRAWTGKSNDRHAVVADCLSRLRAHRAADNVPRFLEVSITGEHLMAFLAGLSRLRRTSELPRRVIPTSGSTFEATIERSFGSFAINSPSALSPT